MVARVASFEGVNIEVAERSMDDVEALVGPLVTGLAGYEGHTHLLSPDGKALSITFFDSVENAEAAEATFDEEMPRRLGDLFRDWESRRVSVDRYNVAVDERR
jgi:hypothetical protein